MSLAKQSSGLTSRIDPPIRNEVGSQGDSAMRVLVNGVRLFFDVEGTKLVPNGPAMRERSTLLLLRPRCRRTRILCNSNGLPIAGMRWSPMRPNGPWR
jgi:hypothetical protein